MENPIILPMFFHVCWTFVLYGLLTAVRAPRVWGIAIAVGEKWVFKKVEPSISANLSNQFEWPLFFHCACLMIIASASPMNIAYLYLAWLFVLARVVHSLVQVFTKNVRLRGLVFTINFLAVFGMWLLLVGGHLANAAAT